MFDESLEELNVQRSNRPFWPQSPRPNVYHSTPIDSRRTLPGALFNDSLSVIFDENEEEIQPSEKTRPNISGQDRFIPDRQSFSPLVANTLLRRSAASILSHSTNRSSLETTFSSTTHYQDKLIRGLLGLSHQDILNFSSSESERRTNKTHNLKRYIPLTADAKFCYEKNPDFEIEPKTIAWNKRTNRISLPCAEGLALWHPVINHTTTFPLELKEIKTMAWNVEQSILAMADNKGKLVFWNSETNKKTITEVKFEDKVHVIELMVWSSYGSVLDHLEILFIMTKDGTLAEVRVDLPVIGLKRLSKTRMANPTSLVVSSDGGRVACSTSGGDVAVSKTKSFENLTNYKFKSIGNYGQVISWCPWEPKVLAVGSSVGKTLTIFNLSKGVSDGASAHIQSATSCMDGITSLAWSEDFKEILSGHSAPHPSVVCWKFPEMTKVFMIDFNSPVLFIDVQMNLESSLIALTANSELTFWKCFDIEVPLGRAPNPVDEGRRRKKGRRSRNLGDISFGCLEGLIR